ncbi:MAG: AAA family ATPase [Candidatus Omnitrophica bacterium]|nr:AAA family ATPase [Candidatus Omnitrophota bacterium]
MIIAVAGKGGTGKTTLAASFIRILKEENAGSVLAIDADPNSNLGELLGVKNVSTIVDIIDDISKNPGQIPPGMTKDRYIELKVQESLDEEEGFDLLTMGRPEGPGCYCFVNNILRELINKLMGSYTWAVIDNEAGMEHMSRRLVRNIDRLYIVSDASAIGVRSARRISQLADELKISVKEKFLVLNKSNKETLKDETDKTGLSLELILPLNDEVSEGAIKGKSIFNLKTDNSMFRLIRETSFMDIFKKKPHKLKNR